MKRYLKLFICLILFFTLFFSTASAADDPIILKVGVYENPPKIYTNEYGRVSGFWPDLIRYIAEEEDWEIEWVPGTWNQGLERLENNQLDIMPDTGWTEPRSQRFAFSNETVLVSWSLLYVPKNSEVQSILDLEGKTIAALKDSFNLNGPEGIMDIFQQFDIEATFLELEDYNDVFESLEDGRADAGVTNKDNGRLIENEYEVSRTPIIFQPA